jgi:hypothetical protein
VRHAQVGKRGVAAVRQSDDVVALEVLRVKRLPADLAKAAGKLVAAAAVAQILGR